MSDIVGAAVGICVDSWGEEVVVRTVVDKLTEGDEVGRCDGSTVGSAEVVIVGVKEGRELGISEGSSEGSLEGMDDGIKVGR